MEETAYLAASPAVGPSSGTPAEVTATEVMIDKGFSSHRAAEAPPEVKRRSPVGTVSLSAHHCRERSHAALYEVAVSVHKVMNPISHGHCFETV
jgi:hypothetical protein